VAERFDGVFPTGYDDVRSLPGVGDYTASAVCSIAYGQPCAVVDGNVYRVLSRLTDADVPTDTAAGKRYYAERARSLLDESRPGLHNQAIMEFGALQCVPANPDCECCPLRDRCLSLARGTVADRPPKREKKAAVPRYFNYLHVRCAGSTLLAKRTGRDIWRNLYEFPLIETPRAVDFGELQRTARWREWFDEAGDVRVSGMLPMPRHVLSHRVIHACFYRVDLPTWPAGLSSFLKVLSSEISRYPVSRLTELYLERGE
jgi:A/G-specific adenine glycosylase